MGWSVWGMLLAGTSALLAIVKSRARGGFYDEAIYGMTPANHRTYAAIFALFVVGFGVTLGLRLGTIALWLFTAFVLVAVFYLTSFLRGAHEDDG